MTSTDHVVVLTTLPVTADAETFARTLVEQRLAACVNLLPEMTSVYRWKGSIEQDRERQVIIKTTSGRVPALQARIRALHPYEVPELVVLPIVGGNPAYLAWIVEATTAPGAASET